MKSNNPTTQPSSSETSWVRFVAGLRAFIAQRTPAQDADDVAQEALLRIHQGAASVRDPQRLQSWVYTVARRAIADHYRGQRPIDTAAGVEPESVADPSAAVAERLATYKGDHSAHEEVLSWLRPLAEQLPEIYREALLLTDFEGQTQRQAASELGLSLAAIKSRVQRGHRLLATELEKCCSVELGAEGRVEDFRRNRCDC